MRFSGYGDGKDGNMVKITGVERASLAEKLGILSGDVLLSLNGNDVRDVLDYRFYLTEKQVVIEVERDGKKLSFSVKKGEYDDVGLEFETPLMDKKQTCHNKCIFCFIDQLPEGLRETLYFKDDDSRLSFLQGNYITLTNLSDADVDRIIKMRLSPINVSVHTTNPELRVKMMKNSHAGEVLRYLDKIADAGLTLRGQIVLCRGINDGEELDRTMRDLSRLYPALDSVSVVPAGLTRYREKLYPLTPYTPEECRAVIAQVETFAKKHRKKTGSYLFHLADEFYIKAGLSLPEEERYEDYPQIENGVGMVTSLRDEFFSALRYRETDGDIAVPRRVSVATGRAAYPLLSSLAAAAGKVFPSLSVTVYPIDNDFFGEEITVSGLLTGKDYLAALAGKDLGDELLLSRSSLRADGDLFLCGTSLEELREKLKIKITPVENDGAVLLDAMLGEMA